MQLSGFNPIFGPAGCLQKISALAWSPDGERLAAASADRVVYLFDSTGARRDKFRTKSADASKSQAYTVRGLAYSPDGCLLAVAQSDASVFVYSLGAAWGDPKAICNHFAAGAAVTCLAWPAGSTAEPAFGCADGQVHGGDLASNTAPAVYAHPAAAAAVSLAARPDGGALVVRGGRFLVAATAGSLLVGDLGDRNEVDSPDPRRLVEVPWHGDGGCRDCYNLNHPQACMAHANGELVLVDCQRLAYLAAARTLHVLDLAAAALVAVIEHCSRVDWLELNEAGTHLLFRDRRRRLHAHLPAEVPAVEALRIRAAGEAASGAAGQSAVLTGQMLGCGGEIGMGGDVPAALEALAGRRDWSRLHSAAAHAGPVAAAKYAVRHAGLLARDGDAAGAAAMLAAGALLRYLAILPADKAFYQAGMA
ncbi:hypothetical protein WJX81_002834, partial [Elliptochloris bilobata]